jgi:hypothetical protein
MVDRRQHRGAHPDDPRDFRSESEPALRSGSFELSWLLERGYSERAALKLVGDKYQFTGRQREAISRAACTDSARARRLEHRADPSQLVDSTLGIDGFNCLITLEVMLSRGPVFVGRDGVLRDLASVHGTYRRVSETEPAIDMVTSALVACRVREVHVLLDRPVANSGRLRALFLEAAARHALNLDCELSDRVDQQLVQCAPLVASSDSWVLDHAVAWLDLPALLAERHNLPLWLLRLT